MWEAREMNKIYGSVATWDDLLRTNLDYFDGKIPMTFHECAPLAPESHELVDNLRELHHRGIYTLTSQPNRPLSTATSGTQYEQRSYLSFYSQDDLAQALLPRLLLDPRIFTECFQVSRQLHWHNYPSNRFNLTRTRPAPWEEGTNWHNSRCHDEYLEMAPPTVKPLLRGAYRFFVSVREWSCDIDASRIVLDTVET